MLPTLDVLERKEQRTELLDVPENKEPHNVPNNEIVNAAEPNPNINNQPLNQQQRNSVPCY